MIKAVTEKAANKLDFLTHLAKRPVPKFVYPAGILGAAALGGAALNGMHDIDKANDIEFNSNWDNALSTLQQRPRHRQPAVPPTNIIAERP